MERNYNTGRDFAYQQGYEGTGPNNTTTSGDILQNFPYLRHGFSFNSQPQTTTISSQLHQDSSNVSVDYNKTDNSSNYQPRFQQISNTQSPLQFNSYGSPTQVGQLSGGLPSVSTFTSILPHSSVSSQFSPKVSNASDVHVTDTSNFIKKSYRYHESVVPCSMTQNNSFPESQSSPLPGFQSLASMTSSANRDQWKTTDPMSYDSGNLHGFSGGNEGKLQQHFDYDNTATQPSNYGSHHVSPKDSTNTSSNFYNLVNHAVKMSPVEVPHIKQLDKTLVPHTSATQPRSDLCYTETSHKVKFFVKGKLSKSKLFNHSPRMSDLVDISDTFNEMGDTPALIPSDLNAIRQSARGIDEANGNEDPLNALYKEPSLAEIRASVDYMSNQSTREAEETSTEITPVCTIKEERVERSDEGIQGFSLGGEGDMHESWYTDAIKRYADITNEETSSVIKGGRSDPDNPFAMTSPSFSASAARAQMVTSNSSTATTVRISIMSIGSRRKLLPNIVNSQAAQGGLVSIVNPIDMMSSSETDFTDPELKSEKTSIMSKLRRDRQDKKDQEEEEVDMEIDRLDVDITIADDQFIEEGSRKGWQCKICPKTYTTKHNLLAHILDHSNIKPHLCLVCGKYFKQLSHLNTHMLTHDQVKPYKCTQCGKGFTQISHMKRHETVHLTKKPYICDICKRGFAYPSELRIHRDKHIFGKEKCTDCDMEFSTLEELKDHMTREKHGDDLTCKHCNRVYKFPCQLRDHMMSHDGARPFICTECGMDFMKEHHLKAHMFTHTGLKPFACPHCHRAFNQKANMVRHMLIHDSDRAFKCEICSKTFTQPQTLKAHMVVHSDRKPYSCRFCGKQFGRQHNLQGHLHMHMDTKPYVCSICQSSFTLKGNLNRHKKVKHGLNESTENMEEDAVNFLSSLSDRTWEGGAGESDMQDDSGTPDSKSSKKARKSIPKKRVQKKVIGGKANDGEDNDNISETEGDNTNLVSYSDEERENEERISKYFVKTEDNDDENAESPKKGKNGTVIRNKENDCDVDDEYNREDVAKTGLERPDAVANIDIVKHEVNVVSTPEKRPVRKRKKKVLDEDFLDYNEAIDGEIEEVNEPRRKGSKHKGTKLDTIIAEKFKNV